jgi:hypothetical protein
VVEEAAHLMVSGKQREREKERERERERWGPHISFNGMTPMTYFFQLDLISENVHCLPIVSPTGTIP